MYSGFFWSMFKTAIQLVFYVDTCASGKYGPISCSMESNSQVYMVALGVGSSPSGASSLISTAAQLALNGPSDALAGIATNVVLIQEV